MINESEVKLVKEFCNSAAGSGLDFDKEWLAAARAKGCVLDELPHWLQEYRAALRTAASRDVVAEADMASVISSNGFSPQQVSNKVHFVMNSGIERKECNAAIQRRSDLTHTVAFECDGHPCKARRRMDTHTLGYPYLQFKSD